MKNTNTTYAEQLLMEFHKCDSLGEHESVQDQIKLVEFMLKKFYYVTEGIKNKEELKKEFESKFSHLNDEPKKVYSMYSIVEVWEWVESEIINKTPANNI